MGKGERTRDRIIGKAMALASRDGFDGVTIGALAGQLRLSKSGLFAHFGSKEELQCSVLQHAAARFTSDVIEPALHTERGEARVRALFERWRKWLLRSTMPGGCVLVTASHEFDDKPGPQRDLIEDQMRRLLDTLARCAESAVRTGEFRADLDTHQFARDWYALMFGYHQLGRLFKERSNEAHLRNAFEQLVSAVRKTGQH
jgi:AcrR family transcriptional regulator